MSLLPLGGTAALFNELTSSVWADNGWKFQKAQQSQDIKGYFDIKVYKPYADPNIKPTGVVGADIQIIYSPVMGDPMGNNVHWIQRVYSNHAITSHLDRMADIKPYGTPEDKIDVTEDQTTTPTYSTPLVPQMKVDNPIFKPYYDTGSSLANQISFEDFPVRPDPQDNNDWNAELYLVQETAPKTVTISVDRKLLRSLWDEYL